MFLDLLLLFPNFPCHIADWVLVHKTNFWSSIHTCMSEQMCIPCFIFRGCCDRKLMLYPTFCTISEKVYVITYTLAGCYAGTAVNQDGGEDRTKHLEALLCLISTPQLDTEQGKDCGCCWLLLPAAWRQQRVTLYLSTTPTVKLLRLLSRKLLFIYQ